MYKVMIWVRDGLITIPTEIELHLANIIFPSEIAQKAEKLITMDIARNAANTFQEPRKDI